MINNMKSIKFLSLIFILALAMVSCEDVMNKKNLKSLVADDIWDDPALVRGLMNNVMNNNLPATPTNWHYYLHALTDEGYSKYATAIPYNDIGISIASDENMGTSSIDRWNYSGIRNINKFLENVDKCTGISPSERNDYKAQMLVLRAWLYFDMVRMYGGVPLVLHEQNLEEDLYVTRNKTSECIAQIVKDLDDAIAYGDEFPMKRDEANAGRITRAVALALKGRILLYYASPQFAHEIPAGTKSAETRWQEAYTANQTAIKELTAAGYGLFRPKPANAEEAITNYYEMFDENNEAPNNPEMIWVRRYQWNVTETSNVSGWAGNAGPTVEFLQAFSNANGTPYTGFTIPSDGAVVTAPYWIGREPRFYAFVAYNGCKWHRYITSSEISGDEDATGKMIHYWNYLNAPSPYTNLSNDAIGGNYRKMNDADINNKVPDGNHSGRDLPILRYAELLLNFAECAAKTNHETEAIQALKDIRTRAGIPASNNCGLGAPSGDDLLLAILKERQIELAIEDFRHYDLRRWRLYTDDIKGYTINGLMRHGFQPRPKAGVAITHDLLRNMDIDANPNSYFEVFDNEVHVMDVQGYSFGERQYFYRIPYEQHIKKNPKLEQTRLWDNGTFNPYE
jgi:hypothetical protein